MVVLWVCSTINTYICGLHICNLRRKAINHVFMCSRFRRYADLNSTEHGKRILISEVFSNYHLLSRGSKTLGGGNRYRFIYGCLQKPCFSWPIFKGAGEAARLGCQTKYDKLVIIVIIEANQQFVLHLQSSFVKSLSLLNIQLQIRYKNL